ncbi:MAG TPA: hypothetical protein ENJ17_01130 [Gammaproteobacteria bacterium]|nr:hypothetical protein [Gammaproteobacteria bacterium]
MSASVEKYTNSQNRAQDLYDFCHELIETIDTLDARNNINVTMEMIAREVALTCRRSTYDDAKDHLYGWHFFMSTTISELFSLAEASIESPGSNGDTSGEPGREAQA